MTFHAQSGRIYLSTHEIAPDLAEELLTLFARDGAVDLVAGLAKARRESRAQLASMEIAK